MITRRHIRVKVMQVLYASLSNDSDSLNQNKTFLDENIKNIQGLYLSLWTLFIAIQQHAKSLVENSKKQYLSSIRLSDNSVRDALAENKLIELLKKNDFKSKIYKKEKIIDWDLNNKYVQLIYDSIIDFDYKLNLNNFKDHQTLLIILFQKVIAPHSKLYECIEENQLTWIDDFPLVNTFLLKKMSGIKSDSASSYIFSDVFKNKEDEEFAHKLLEVTLLESERLQPIISEKTVNWEVDRIAKMDTIIIKLALSEVLHFKEIPTRVTINEYIEISKEYATPKSNSFVNGILDKIIKSFEISGKLKKQITT